MRTLIAWSFGTFLVGLAQLYRSDIEIIIGSVYIAASILLLIAGITRSFKLISLAYTILGTAFAARGITASFILPITERWDAYVLVTVTWLGFAALAFKESVLIGRGAKDV